MSGDGKRADRLNAVLGNVGVRFGILRANVVVLFVEAGFLAVFVVVDLLHFGGV